MLLTILSELHDQVENDRSKPDLETKTNERLSLRLPSPGRDEVPRREEERVGLWALFEPAAVVDGERLIFHLLGFLRERYLHGVKGVPFAGAVEHEAKALAPERFLDYLKETATSEPKLREATVKFHQELGERSKHVREDVRCTLLGLGRLVLLVDDLDLQPQHAYDLLQILHTYFRDVDMVVVLAADHEQLLASIDHSLQKRKIINAGLGGQILVKHVTAEWRLPTPSLEERRDELLKWVRKPKPGYRSFEFSAWWNGFRAPQQPTSNVEKGEGHIHVASRRGDARSAVMGRLDWQREDVERFFAEAAPSTWRGLNRLHNRAISLEELHGSIKALNEAYRGAVGSSIGNVSSFLALLLAMDESFPELLIFESFEEHPDRLRRGLVPAPALFPDRERGINKRQERRTTQQWNITNKEAWSFPVRDRLLDPKVISGRRRGRAEELLLTLGTLWQDVWERSAQEEGGASSFLAISVSGDAKERARPWWGRFLAREDDVSHADLRGMVSGSRPTTMEMRAVVVRLEEMYGEKLRVDEQQIFAMASLSVAAWIGWYGRYAKGLKVVGYDREAGFQVFSPPARYDVLEPGLVFFDEPVRAVAEQLDAKSLDAAILLDVREHPDRSPSLLPFRHDTGGQAIRFAQALKLVCEPGFRLDGDEQVAAIIHDLGVVLDGLRRDHGIQRVHLAFACPAALAMLVGRVLHPWTPVLLYDYQPLAELGPAYEHVITLE